MTVAKFILLASLILAFSHHAASQQSIAQDTFIILERHPSFDYSCPFYKLTISAEGTVELQLKDFNNETKDEVITGKVIKSQISQEQLKQLVSEFEMIDFYSIKNTFENKSNDNDVCPYRRSDCPTTLISLTKNGKSKTVEHYHGCHGSKVLDKLTNLEDKIDEIVNIKQWVDCYKGKNRKTLLGQSNKR